jgi:hypothetical protein
VLPGGSRPSTPVLPAVRPIVRAHRSSTRTRRARGLLAINSAVLRLCLRLVLPVGALLFPAPVILLAAVRLFAAVLLVLVVGLSVPRRRALTPLGQRASPSRRGRLLGGGIRGAKSAGSGKPSAKIVFRAVKASGGGSLGAAGRKRKRSGMPPHDDDGNVDGDSADDDDDDANNEDCSPCRAAKKTAPARGASRDSPAAASAAAGKSTSAGPSPKRPRASQDPHGMKPKRAARATVQLMKEQKAAAFAEKLAKCPGVIPPPPQIGALGRGTRIPMRTWMVTGVSAVSGSPFRS